MDPPITQASAFPAVKAGTALLRAPGTCERAPQPPPGHPFSIATCDCGLNEPNHPFDLLDRVLVARITSA